MFEPYRRTHTRRTKIVATIGPASRGKEQLSALLEAGVFSTETLTEDADMTMAVIRSDYRVVYEENAVATTEAPDVLWTHLASRSQNSTVCFSHLMVNASLELEPTIAFASGS